MIPSKCQKFTYLRQGAVFKYCDRFRNRIKRIAIELFEEKSEIPVITLL